MYFQIGRLGLPFLAIIFLAGCGQGDGEKADTGLPFSDVVVIGEKDGIVFFDQNGPFDTWKDSVGEDHWVPDDSVDPDGEFLDVWDTSPEIHPTDIVPDLPKDLAPELVDIIEDEETDIPPELCNGQLCPDDRPMCNNGQCVCTGNVLVRETPFLSQLRDDIMLSERRK